MKARKLKYKFIYKKNKRTKAPQNNIKSKMFFYLYTVLLIYIIDPIAVYCDLKTEFIAKTASIGLVVDEIVIEGNYRISDNEIKNLAKISKNQSIIELDLLQIQNAIKGDCRIKAVAIRRILPAKIIINIEEKIPIAIWMSNNQKYLMDIDGNIITPPNVFDIKANFITVICDEVYRCRYKDIFNVIKNSNTFEKIVILDYISGRRWNLYLDNGVMVKLPHSNEKQAIALLEEILKSNNFGKKISMIDLRLLPRKIYIN